MDELELLKKDWKKQEANLPKFSYDQLYKMIWKRSSSIVKWIFIISILEFLFWTVLNFVLADEDYWQEMKRLSLTNFTIVLYVLNYAVTFFFIYCFYRNYKRISSTDTAVGLMKNILRTRKTVKYYIGYILLSTAVVSLVYTYYMVYYHISHSKVQESSKYVFTTEQWFKFVGFLVLFLGIFLALIWLFYRLLYGILLKRLSKNYKELKKMEMEA
ncbi:MAG: hypothetical protein WBV11_04855 [Salegentibacter sp.]